VQTLAHLPLRIQ